MMKILLEIPRRSAACVEGHETFAQDMEYYSTLEETEEGYLRRDYCLACWERVKPEHAVTHWKSRVPSKKEESRLPADRDERALVLLKQALEQSNEEEAFVLALYLARRRKLYLRQELLKENGDTVGLYEVAATEEMLAVKRLALSSLQTEKIQLALAQKFNGK